MTKKKLSPLEALEKRKLYLQLKSDALVDVMDTNFQYVQDNLGSLIGQATTDAIISKLPPFVQNLLGKGEKKESETPSLISTDNLAKYDTYVESALDMLPMFFKGFKGVAITFLLKKAKDLIFKKK